MSSKLEKIKKLNQRAWALCKKDGPKALSLARRAQDLLSTCAQAQPIDEYECLRTQTYCLDMLGKPEDALPVGIKAAQLAEQIGDKYLISYIHSVLGRIYWHIDDFATSMDYYLSGLKLVQTENHPELEISLMNGLGMVQYGLENYPASLESFKTCLEKADEDDLVGRADANNNISYVLHVLGRDQEAVEYARVALSLFNQLGTYVGKIYTLHSLGAILISLQDYDQAMEVLQDGLDLSRRNNSQLIEVSYIIEICRILRIRGKLDQAEKEILLALRSAEKINSLTNISLIHEFLTDIYKEKHDYKSALEQFEAYHATFKKVFNDKSDRRIKNLEILHQVEITRKQADLYRELAGTDFLTSLVNRRRFMEIAELAIQRANTEKGQLAILMLDIDHFKRVNDQYGHNVGDEVLASVAARIKKSLRQGDIAGRYGGEEFIVLVLDSSSGHCFDIAERIRLAVAQHSIRINQESISVTVSLGLVCVNSNQELPLDTLISYADQAMYSAKRQGRNRVVDWDSLSLSQVTPSSIAFDALA